MILIYPLGIPLLFAAILFYYRTRRHLVMVNDKIGLLFSAYKYKYFFWDLFEMLRLLALSLLASYASNIPQQVAACIILLITLLIHSSAQPYQFAVVNRAVGASYCVLFTTVFVAMLLGTIDCDAYKNTQQYDDAIYNSSDFARAFSWCTNYRSAMITFIFVLNCVYLGVIAIVASWEKIKDVRQHGLKRTLHFYTCGLLFRKQFAKERMNILKDRAKAKATEESLYGTEMSSTFGGSEPTNKSEKTQHATRQEVGTEKRITNPFASTNILEEANKSSVSLLASTPAWKQ